MLKWLGEREANIARLGADMGDTGRRFVADATRSTQEAFARLSDRGDGSRLRNPRSPTHGQAISLDEQILRNARRLEAQAKAGVAVALKRAASSPAVRRAASDVGQASGNLVGLATGALQTAEDLKDGAVIVARLFDVTEPWRVPRGEAAWDQVAGSAGAIVAQGEKALTNPRAAAADVSRFAQRKRMELDPNATPPSPTLAGEVRRNFDIGRNQGELIADAAGLAVGGLALKTASGIGRLSKAERIAKHLDEGFTEAKAGHLAEIYKGKGHHALIPERARLPAILGGGPYPRWVLDNPFNRLHPTGISRGEFYELHSQVDPFFRGTRFPPRMGPGGWSAKRLGIEKYGPLGRAYHGTPGPTKAVIGGAAVAGGGYLNEAMEEAGWR